MRIRASNRDLVSALEDVLRYLHAVQHVRGSGCFVHAYQGRQTGDRVVLLWAEKGAWLAMP